MANKNILIVEDEELLLSIYKDYSSNIFADVFIAKNCHEAIDILDTKNIDCVLLDNKLPDGLGISIAEHLKNKEINIPVILITAYADKELAIASVNTGVFYFLEKPVTKKELIDVLQKCYDYLLKKSGLQDKEYFYLLTERTIKYLKENYNLTDREVEVVSYALHHHKNNDVAEKLFISTGTVKRHLHNIFEKLVISSREELKELISKLNHS